MVSDRASRADRNAEGLRPVRCARPNILYCHSLTRSSIRCSDIYTGERVRSVAVSQCMRDENRMWSHSTLRMTVT